MQSNNKERFRKIFMSFWKKRCRWHTTHGYIPRSFVSSGFSLLQIVWLFVMLNCNRNLLSLESSCVCKHLFFYTNWISEFQTFVKFYTVTLDEFEAVTFVDFEAVTFGRIWGCIFGRVWVCLFGRILGCNFGRIWGCNFDRIWGCNFGRFWGCNIRWSMRLSLWSNMSL